jgi:hypothetical protein
MGEAASFIFNSSVVGEVVERVTYIAEFLLDVMPVLVKAAKQFWKTVREEEAEAALLIVFLQYISEHSVGNEAEYEVLRENIGETVEFVQTMVRANFKWDEVDLSFIKDRIAVYGDKLLSALVTLTKDFLYRRCETADSTVEFSVDSAGDEDLLGLWIVNGTEGGRPKYTKRSNSGKSLEWRSGSWHFRDAGMLWSKTLYRSEVDSATPPTTGWAAENGKLPTPEVIPLKQ